MIAGKYIVKKVLRKGFFGEILHVKYQQSDYAIKLFINLLFKKKEPQYISYVEWQIKCMRQIDSEYVIKLIDVSQDETAKYMICEYCNGGNLFQYQCKLPNMVIPYEKTFLIVSQIIKGIQHLHELQYLHRDLKPQNILVKKNGNDEIFKIAGFGFARKEQATTGTILGTGKFMAPEIYKEQKYGYGVDMWALGVIIFFMPNNDYPFKDPTRDQQIRIIQQKCTPYFSYEENVKKTKRNLLINCTPETQQLFRRIFEFYPQERLTFREIKQLPLFKYKKFLTSKELEEYSQIINNSSIYQLQVLPQKQIITKEIQIKYYLDYIKFLHELSDFFKVENQYLIPELKLILRYNLLKLCLLNAKKLQSLLKQSNVPQGCKKLNWRQFFKSERSTIILKKLDDDIQQITAKFEQSYDNCYDHKIQIKKVIPEFFQSVNFKIQQKSFEDFKVTFRTSTSLTNDHLAKIQQNNISKNIIVPIDFTLLRVKVLICHVINRIFLKSDLRKNFVHYFEWKKSFIEMKADRYNFCFDSFKIWLNQASNNLQQKLQISYGNDILFDSIYKFSDKFKKKFQ